MKHALLLLLIVMVNFTAFAQDYIVINGKDTINCKINEITSNEIFFTIQQNDIPIKSSLPMSKVNAYYFNNNGDDQSIPINQENEVVTNETYVNKEQVKIKVPIDYQRFRINAEIGFGYMVADIPPNAPQEVKDYFEQLKSGTHYSFGGSYFIKRSFGLGAKASLFYTQNQMSISLYDANGNVINGLMKDDISITYFGAYVAGRSFAKNGISGFYFELGLGKTSYENRAVFIDNYNITGSKVGIDFTIDYDIKLGNSLALGLGLNYNIAVLDEIMVNGQKYTLTADAKENISRINMMIGLRYLIQ
ncbi:MAG: hypothetical protein HYU68_13900 [Bacteroidetes bacterium]|nr:hypothetical protein [Bacteroidota bacterium]